MSGTTFWKTKLCARQVFETLNLGTKATCRNSIVCPQHGFENQNDVWGYICDNESVVEAFLNKSKANQSQRFGSPGHAGTLQVGSFQGRSRRALCSSLPMPVQIWRCAICSCVQNVPPAATADPVTTGCLQPPWIAAPSYAKSTM